MVCALWIAVGVGTLLLLINHGDHLLQEPLCPHFFLKAGLTYLTPLLVSLVSSELASRNELCRRETNRTGDRTC